MYIVYPRNCCLLFDTTNENVQKDPYIIPSTNTSLTSHSKRPPFYHIPDINRTLLVTGKPHKEDSNNQQRIARGWCFDMAL